MTDEKFRIFLNYVAAIILCCCILGMIAWAWASFNTVPPQTHKIILTVSPDSVHDSKKFSYYTDSLIQVIGKHEHVIADKYEAVLDEKVDSPKYWSIAGVLVSVVLGVAGFFGFKTFKDIESDCKKTAEDVANEKAIEVAKATSKNESQQYLDSHLSIEVQNASDVYLGNQERHIEDMVRNAVASAQNEFSDNIDELYEKLNDLDSRLTVFEGTVNTNDMQHTSSDQRTAEDPMENTSNACDNNHAVTDDISLFE